MEKIKDIWFENERIYMLSDADHIYSRSLEAFPLLKNASNRDRANFTIEMRGSALRWKDLDEDIHISSFLRGDENLKGGSKTWEAAQRLKGTVVVNDPRLYL